MKYAKNISVTLICIVLGLMLAWQYRSINFNKNQVTTQSRRIEVITDELIKQRQENDNLRLRLTELEEENRQYALNRQGNDDLIKQLERYKMIAGLIDVKGSGLIITMNNGTNTVIEDTDILKIINELRASDVQAISVNDERMTATSEVRTVDPYIMINGRQMLAPYVIKAIGEPEKMERSLKIINGVLEWFEAMEIKVDVKQASEITIPKVRDDGTVIRTNLLTPLK